LMMFAHLFSHDLGHGRFGSVGDDFEGVDKLFASRAGQ